MFNKDILNNNITIEIFIVDMYVENKSNPVKLTMNPGKFLSNNSTPVQFEDSAPIAFCNFACPDSLSAFSYPVDIPFSHNICQKEFVLIKVLSILILNNKYELI